MDQRRKEQWDAIVVGSGIGGLTAAAYLCLSGKRTLVLESHYVAGGMSQVFRRRRGELQYEFDVGVHYVGECGQGGIVHSILHSLGLAEHIKFRELDPDGFSTLVFPDFTFRVPTGWDRYRERLLAQFSHEAEPLGKVIDVMRTVGEAVQRLKRCKTTLQRLFAEEPAFLTWGLRPIVDLFEEYKISQQSRAVILGEQRVYAVPPSRTPGAIASGALDHYMGGAFYPVGGGQELAAQLLRVIRANGGELRTCTRVQRIRVQDGRVKGVTLERNGQELDANVVISNADLQRTLLEMVGTDFLGDQTVERLRGYRTACPLFVAYLGLDTPVEHWNVTNTNYHVWNTYDIEGQYERLETGRFLEKPTIMISPVVPKDPNRTGWAAPAHSAVELVAAVPRGFGYWEDDPQSDPDGYSRNVTYVKRKEAYIDTLVRVAERVLPGLASAIVWREASTPFTQHRYTGALGGSAYGVEMSTSSFGPLRLGPASDVAGLFLCGAGTPAGPGIANAFRSGVLAAEAVLERSLMEPTMSGRVLARSDLRPLPADWDAWRACH